MPKVVQFMHPGPEHGPNNKDKNHKSWNDKDHKRKFLLTKGDYVDGNNSVKKNKQLTFWGEWEPPSDVEAIKSVKNIKQKEKTLLPKWLHTPILPAKPEKNYILNIDCSGKGVPAYQNTDPCVFGDTFKYLGCKQSKKYKINKNKNKTKILPTEMSNLDVGSLILFGSQKKVNGIAVFLLDTVFVISDESVDYNPSENNASLFKKISSIYTNYIYKLMYPNIDKKTNVKLRFYRGVTYEERAKFNGMYSFTPAKLYDENKVGFSRVVVKNDSVKIPLEILNPKNGQANKMSDLSHKEVASIWNLIRTISREQRCVEAIRFPYPKVK